MREENYSVDVVGMIAQTIKGYIGHDAIISELLQNADDASATHISFHFRRDYLEVRNNSYFNESDWENIRKIASSGKRTQEGKTGAFGTGFISVYHITDEPHIFSSQQHKIISPLSGKIRAEEASEIGKETRFHFYWRTTSSELSQRIEGKVWDTQSIEEFRHHAEVFIPKAFLFLRHIRTIELFHEDQLRVVIKRARVDGSSGGVGEIWEITHNGQVQRWLYYRGTVDKPNAKNITVKDREITLALPLSATPVQGFLYNFLPTQINTGFPFHCNGAFFPDNNRRGILNSIETNPDNTQWNYQVIESIAHLLGQVLVDIRNQFIQAGLKPRDFYRVWLSNAPKQYPFLEIIFQHFIEVAKESPIVLSTLQSWEKPSAIWIASGNLFDLAHAHMSLLPEDAMERASFLGNHLGSPRLTLQAMLRNIQPHLHSDLPLHQAHPMLNSREKLQLLYQQFPENGHPELLQWLCQLPIFLREDQHLVSAIEIWSAEKSTRELFAHHDRPPFADEQLQAVLPEGYLNPFKGLELAQWLEKWQEEHPASVYFDSDDDAIRMIRYIGQDKNRLNHHQLAPLYMIKVVGDESWYRTEDFSIYAYEAEAEALGLNNLLLVQPQLGQKQDIMQVYTLAGVRELDVETLVQHLISAHIADDKLKSLYRYLSKLRFNTAVRDKLKTLNIFRTANDRRTSLRAQPDLARKPQVPFRDWKKVSSVIDKLGLDNYVHESLEEEDFLEQMGIMPLSEETFNERLVRDYYHRPSLTHEDRLILLEYLKSLVDNAELLEVMRSSSLILCEDGNYRKADECTDPLGLDRGLNEVSYVQERDERCERDGSSQASSRAGWCWNC